MPSGFYIWSETAAANGTADSSAPWPEGMSPSAINDSARAMMAVLRRWGSDISGAIVTTGSSTAYAVTSHSTYDSLAHLDGQMIAFTPHTTCGTTVTLNVDGLGAKPLRSAPSADLVSGHLIQGTPYVAIYNNSDGAFYLQGFFGNPYGIPIGGVLPYTGTSSPNSSFVLPYGQAISRTTYASYFSLVGTTFGGGDGSSTFNVPDLRGRVIAGLDNMGGSVASRLTSSYFGGTATNLGAVGGSESHTLTTAQLAVHTHANALTDPGHTHSTNANTGNNQAGTNPGAGSNAAATINSSTTGITLTNASAGSGNAHNNTQPTMVLGLILRII